MAYSPTASVNFSDLNSINSGGSITPKTVNTSGGSLFQVPPSSAPTVGQANTTNPNPVSTAVVTSKTAQDDYNQKYAAYQNTLAQVGQQKDLQSQQQAAQQAYQAAGDLQKSELGLKQQGLDIQKSQADAANALAQSKLVAANALTAPEGGSNTQTTPQYQPNNAPNSSVTPTPANPQTTTTGSTAVTPSTQQYIQDVQGVDQARTQALNSFMQQANNMIVGLNQSESALLSATQQSFQNVLNNQTVANNAYTGAVTEAQARAGGEYTPSQEAGNIAAAVNVGSQRLSEINSTMATTLANLQTSFEKQDYQMMNDNFTKLDNAYNDRMTAIKDVHDAVASDVAAQQKEKTDAQNQELAINKYKLDVANSAEDNKLKSAQIAKIYNDMSTTDISSAADWVKNIQSGVAKLSDVPAGLKTAVSSGLANGNPQGVNAILTTTQNSLKTLNDFVDENHGFTAAVGAKGLTGAGPLGLVGQLFGYEGSPIAGTQAADFDAKLKQVVNDVVLPNLTILHGLGRVTDREFQSLQSSITSLNPNLSESEFKNELKSVTDFVNQKINDTNTHNGIQLPTPQNQGNGNYNGITLPN